MDWFLCDNGLRHERVNNSSFECAVMNLQIGLNLIEIIKYLINKTMAVSNRIMGKGKKLPKMA